MTQNREALQAFVDGIRPNVAEVHVTLRRDIVWRPDPATGLPADVVGPSGEVVTFDTEVIHVKIGRCACAFDVTDGSDKSPPDLRRPFAQSEIEQRLREALASAAVEAGKGKPREEKIEKERQRSLNKARQILQAQRAARPAPAPFRYRKPAAPLADILAVAVQSGRMTQEEANARLADGEDPDDPVGG